jgi:two-component system nitrate/nitrite response regulator NarL
MTRIMIVDDHAVFRTGLAAVIKTMPKFELVAQANTCASAIAQAREYRPDVVTMDLSLPDGSGVNCLAALHQIISDVKVLVITVSDRDRDLFAAVKAGARGYILKHVTLDELCTALNLVAAGEAIISPGMAARLMQEFQTPRTEPKQESVPQLSDRELEVLRLVASGCGNREISLGLFISEATVKAHLRSMLEKLHVRNRAQAVAIATAKGIL